MMTSRVNYFIHRLGLILILALLLVSCGPQDSQNTLTRLQRTQIMMGDVAVSVTLIAPQSAAEASWETLSGTLALAREIEAELSEFRPDSQTRQLIAHAGGEPSPIGPHLMRVLTEARIVAVATEGYFDVSYPSPQPEVSYRDVLLDPIRQRALLAHADMKISLSGIAKGYIVDEMAAHLLDAGYENFLINAGGDIYLQGRDLEGPWQVSLRDPSKKTVSDTMITFSLQSGAVATSGTYARGRHLVDPHTGLHLPDTNQSVTIFSPRTSLADALATAIYAAQEKAAPLLKKLTALKLIDGAIIAKPPNPLKQYGRLPVAPKGNGLDKSASSVLPEPPDEKL